MGFFYRRTVPGLAIHSYLVGEESLGECVVIDPVRDVDEYLAVAKEHDLAITHILETHVHADFISGAREMKERLNNEPIIHCSGMGGKEWVPLYADQVVQEGDEIQLGCLKFQAVHTPGHTPEHVMWAMSENGSVTKLFTGDFLFIGDVGRPDLLGKEASMALAHQLYQSVFGKLQSYAGTVEIRPAHGAGSLCGKALSAKPFSTLGEERKSNPSLRPLSEQEWTRLLMEEMPPVPRYFARMKKLNVAGAPLLGADLRIDTLLTPEEALRRMQEGVVLLDLRTKEEFARGHCAGAINIPFGSQISTWAGSLLRADASLILVVDDTSQLVPSVHQLIRVGLDKIIGYFSGDALRKIGNRLEMLETISVQELHRLLHERQDLCVVDVRSLQEWKGGHLKEALHIPGIAVEDALDRLPAQRSIAVVCGSGFRSSIVASFLKKKGFSSVSSVAGGMTEWQSQGFPVV